MASIEHEAKEGGRECLRGCAEFDGIPMHVLLEEMMVLRSGAPSPEIRLEMLFEVQIAAELPQDKATLWRWCLEIEDEYRFISPPSHEYRYRGPVAALGVPRVDSPPDTDAYRFRSPPADGWDCPPPSPKAPGPHIVKAVAREDPDDWLEWLPW